MTTYDEIYECFLENGRLEDSALPQTQDRIYSLIENAIRIFNIKMETKYSCDREKEIISVKMSDIELIILAYIIRQILLENEYTHFITTWSPFSKEIGIANYKSQENAKKQAMETAKKRVNEFISIYEDADIMS